MITALAAATEAVATAKANRIARDKPVELAPNPSHPDASLLWRIANDTNATVIGISPTYIQLVRGQGILPRARVPRAPRPTGGRVGGPPPGAVAPRGPPPAPRAAASASVPHCPSRWAWQRR